MVSKGDALGILSYELDVFPLIYFILFIGYFD